MLNSKKKVTVVSVTVILAIAMLALSTMPLSFGAYQSSSVIYYSNGQNFVVSSSGDCNTVGCGPNIQAVANSPNGVPSIQLLIRNSQGVLQMMASFYNDGYNTVLSAWKNGQLQFYTWSESNPNKVSQKMYFDPGDKADAGFKNLKYLHAFKDDGQTEGWALDVQTGIQYLKGSLVVDKSDVDIGSPEKPVNDLYVQYLALDSFRPRTSNTVPIQNKYGVMQFEFTDLESETDDAAFTPKGAVSGNMGTQDHRLKGAFFRSFNINGDFVLQDENGNTVIYMDKNGIAYRGSKMVTQTQYDELNTKLTGICRDLAANNINLASCQ